MNGFEKKHSAAHSDAAYSYQFYCFINHLLKMKGGDITGYEVKDDIHTVSSNNELTLIQVKHTNQKSKVGEPINLTNLDTDLWKTLANWIQWNTFSKKTTEELKKVSYVLLTNKEANNDVYKNIKDFQNKIVKVDDIITLLQNLYAKCSDEEIKGYIQTVKTYNKPRLKIFLSNIQIEIEQNITNSIRKNLEPFCRFNPKSLEKVYNLLLSTIFEDKFHTITDNTSFILSYDDFTNKYRLCFEEAYKREKLPIRYIPIEKSLNFDELNQRIYIKQLRDIHAIRNEEDLVNIYNHRLCWENHLTDWENGYLLPSEYKILKENAKAYWKNSFDEVYYPLHVKLDKDPVCKLDEETEILPLAFRCLSDVRKKDLHHYEQNLNTILSNGCYYSLSDTPEIGWHIHWEKKYKKES